MHTYSMSLLETYARWLRVARTAKQDLFYWEHKNVHESLNAMEFIAWLHIKEINRDLDWC